MAKVRQDRDRDTGDGDKSSSKVVVKYCDLFNKTAAQHLRPGTPIYKSFTDFITTKVANPIAQYGSSDKKNPSGTPMSIEVPGIRHAHLTHDISVFYTVSGANPTLLKLYAIMTHDEAGSGQPSNHKVQKGVAKRMANQTFLQ